MSKLNIGAALTKAAVVISKAAQDHAPVDTGDLQASIHPGDVKKSGRNYSIEVGADPVELSGDVNYVNFVHFGTGIYGPKKKGKGGQKPQPFFDEALSSAEDAAVEAFENALEIQW